MPFKELAIPKTLSDLCNDRVKAIGMLRSAEKLLKDAEALLNTAGRYILPMDAKPRSSIEETVKNMDRRLWSMAYDLTGLGQCMDHQARVEFNRALEKSPPEFTVANVREQFITALQDSDEMFSRGLVNVFLQLSKHHKTNTNSPFKVNEKAVMEYMVNQDYGHPRISYGQAASDKLNDIDRVFKTLDGKKHNPRELECAMNKQWSETKESVFEDDYYHARGFKNGNLHLRFKRIDLLEKANRIISDFYNGSALAQGRASA